MLWQVDIYPAPGQPDLEAARVKSEAFDLGLGDSLAVTSGRGFLLAGAADLPQVERLARGLLSDSIVERSVTARVGDSVLAQPPAGREQVIHVLPRPGVMDPVAQSTLALLDELGLPVEAVRTLR